MKKVKLVGALLAAVIAAAPATGLTSSVLSFNDNAIVAEAVGTPSFFSSKTVNVTADEQTILRNGSYELRVTRTGEFYIRGNGKNKYFKQKNNNGSVIDFHCPYDRNSIYPGTNEHIMYVFNRIEYMRNFTLEFQSDGNLVAYSNGRPLWHTDTWRFNTSDVKLTYELTASGVLQIRRTFIKGQFKGKSDIVWNSNTCYIYRIV